MRYLGIDHGNKRTGLAVGDDDGRVAVPLRVIEEEQMGRVIERVQAVVGAEEIDTIIVGVPLSMRLRDAAAIGPQSQDLQNGQYAKVQQFIDALREVVSIPVVTMDERLSTVEAERRMQGSAKNVRAQKDAVAASIILQSYLDRQLTSDM